MAKHLTDKNIEEVVKLIDGWPRDTKLSYDKLCEKAAKQLGVSSTRQTLQKFARIKAAMSNRKSSLKSEPGRKVPPSLAIAASRIEKLERENARLLQEQTNLLAQFMVWQYNSYAHGMTKEALNRPMPSTGR